MIHYMKNLQQFLKVFGFHFLEQDYAYSYWSLFRNCSFQCLIDIFLYLEYTNINI